MSRLSKRILEHIRFTVFGLSYEVLLFMILDIDSLYYLFYMMVLCQIICGIIAATRSSNQEDALQCM